MTAEIFKIEIPRRTFVFVSAGTNERLDHFGRALIGLGASVIGSQAYALSADVTLEAVRDAVGSITVSECVYFVSAAGGTLESRVLVPPREE